MKRKEPPDWQKIRDYMDTGRSITRLQCLIKFGCINLPGRIYDLKHMGYNIDDLPVHLDNGKIVSKYFLVDKYKGTDYAARDRNRPPNL